MRARSIACHILALTALAWASSGAARAAEAPPTEVDLTWGAKIPLRDGVKLNATIGLEKNYAGGGEVARESIKDARTVHVRLVHDREHPSRLELPIVKEKP